MDRREFIKGVFGTAVAAAVPLPIQGPIKFLHITEQATWNGKEFRCNPAQTIIFKSEPLRSSDNHLSVFIENSRQMGMTDNTMNHFWGMYCESMKAKHD